MVSSLSPSERQQLAEGFLENSGYDEPSNESELPRLYNHSIFYDMYMYQLIIKTGRRSTRTYKAPLKRISNKTTNKYETACCLNLFFNIIGLRHKNVRMLLLYKIKQPKPKC